MASSERDKRLIFEAKLKQTGSIITISSASQLERAQAELSKTQTELRVKLADAIKQLSRCEYELGTHQNQLDEDANELESLRRRKGNLPVQQPPTDRTGACAC